MHYFHEFITDIKIRINQVGGTGNLQTFDDDLEIFSYNILF